MLVVDDDRDLAMSLADVLNISGHSAKVAYSGEAALRRATAETFDFALLDFDLPDMTGVEVMARLHEHVPALRTRLMTAYSPQHVRERSGSIDINTILVKPLDLDWLLDTLDNRRDT